MHVAIVGLEYLVWSCICRIWSSNPNNDISHSLEWASNVIQFGEANILSENSRHDTVKMQATKWGRPNAWSDYWSGGCMCVCVCVCARACVCGLWFWLTFNSFYASEICMWYIALFRFFGTAQLFVVVHTVHLTSPRLRLWTQSSCLCYKVQKAQLSQRDRATRYVSWNLVNCRTTVRRSHFERPAIVA